MKYLTLSLALLLTVFIACKPDGSSSPSGSSDMVDGYAYKVLKKGNGKKAEKNDLVFFEIDILSPTDSVLQSRTSFRQQPSMLIPEEELAGKKNPIMSLLAKSSIGDSLELIMPKDSMKGAPQSMQGMEYIKYILAVKKMVNQEAFIAEEKALQEKSKVREVEVSNIVKSTIADYKANKSKVVSLESGLKYILHEEGTGELPAIGKSVDVNYYGVLLDNGKMFDNSFKRGKEFSFPLGQGRVIKGWDEGIAVLKKGSKATLIIPAELGYGAAGSPPSIPGGSTLAFYVEVL